MLFSLPAPTPLFPPHRMSSAAGFTSIALAATNKKVAFVITLPPGKTIDTVGYYATAQAGTPGLRISIQGVTSKTAVADGSIKSSGNAKVDFTGGSDTLNGWTTKTLGASYTNANAYPEQVAVVIEESGSGNPLGASHSLTVAQVTNTGSQTAVGSPGFAASKTATTWTVATATPVAIIKNASTGEYFGQTWTGKAPANQATSNVSSDGYGFRMDAKFNARVSGVYIMARMAANAGFGIQVRKNGAFVEDLQWSEALICSSESAAQYIYVPFKNGVLVQPGDYIQVIFYGTGITGQTYFPKTIFASTADLQAMYGAGMQGCRFSYAISTDPTNPDSYTDEPTNFYAMVPAIDQVDTAPIPKYQASMNASLQ